MLLEEDNLWFNLMLGNDANLPLTYDEASCGEALPFVWQLCQQAGISQVLIGQQFDAQSGWQLTRLAAVPYITSSQAFRISLVRAVLAQPLVLLVQAHFDSAWDHELDFVMSYQCGKLEPVLRKIEQASGNLTGSQEGVASVTHTLVLAASDEVLAKHLGKDSLILTIQTASIAHLSEQGGLADVGLADVRLADVPDS